MTSLDPLSPPLFTLHAPNEGQGTPQVILAPFDPKGAPGDLALISMVVAHVVYCLEIPGETARPGGEVTITERGRGVLDAICTIYAPTAPGSPDEDRRRVHALVRFRENWRAYLRARLSYPFEPIPGVIPQFIVCPVVIGDETSLRVHHLNLVPLRAMLDNKLFMLERRKRPKSTLEDVE